MLLNRGTYARGSKGSHIGYMCNLPWTRQIYRKDQWKAIVIQRKLPNISSSLLVVLYLLTEHVFYGSLHEHLIEHLNAEIVLNTINDVSVALEWIKSTFLYIRVMKNPKHYGQVLYYVDNITL